MFKPIRPLMMFLSCVLVAGCTQAQAAEPSPVTLHVGDAAPALAMASFVKGEPVKGIEKGKTYVVEFWATWCGPCRQTIPHLSKMQEKYKDITFIGQDCWEEDQSLVEPFVKKMGDQMNYRVAVDDMAGGGRGKMAETWMSAAGQDGIPTAFLVDGEGKIVFIGHPMELDEVLPDFVKGTFDPKKLAEKHAAFEALGKEIEPPLRAGEFDKAIGIIDKFSKDHPESANRLASVKYGLLLQKKDFPAATAQAAQMYDASKDDSNTCNELAWSMVDPQLKYEKPDLDLALKYAQRALELAGGDPQTMDTLANVYAARGDFVKAIDIETKAVAKAEGDLKAQLQKTLDDFNAKNAKAK